jgi:hypothetical protein
MQKFVFRSLAAAAIAPLRLQSRDAPSLAWRLVRFGGSILKCTQDVSRGTFWVPSTGKFMPKSLILLRAGQNKTANTYVIEIPL